MEKICLGKAGLPYGQILRVRNPSPAYLSVGLVTSALLAAEAQPDEIERPTHADKEADQGEVGGSEEVICCPTRATPEEEAREEVADDRPESVLFASICCHEAMVDEFSTSDN